MNEKYISTGWEGVRSCDGIGHQVEVDRVHVYLPSSRTLGSYLESLSLSCSFSLLYFSSMALKRTQLTRMYYINELENGMVGKLITYWRFSTSYLRSRISGASGPVLAK